MEDDQETYTHGHADSVLRSHRQRTAENSAGYLLPRVSPGLDLLDVGCGPGTITVDLARRVAPGRVLAIDAAVDVVAAAQAEVDAAGVDNVEVRVGDVYALDLEDGSFDLVHAHQVLQHVARPVDALREMRRVCRAGGVVAARDSTYRAMTWSPSEPTMDRWLEVYCAVAEANGGEPDAGIHLEGWAREAGFTEVTPSSSSWHWTTPDERHWWSDLWADRISITALADRAIELGVATREELDAIAAGWRRWGAQPDGWFEVPCGEILATP
jgi:SAM-dependent methyltransferase